MVEKVYLDAFVYSASGNGSLALPLPLATKLHTPAPAPGLRSRAGARAPAREHHCKHRRVFIPRILLTSESELTFIPIKRQFPIHFAYCITIKKGQGQSLETVTLYLPPPEAIYSNGQLYVALSS